MLLETYPDFVLKNAGITEKDFKKIKKIKKKEEILEKINEYTKNCDKDIKILAKKCKINLENRNDIFCKNITVLVDVNEVDWYKKLCEKIGTSSITNSFGERIENFSRDDIANEKNFYIQDLDLEHTEEVVDLHYDNHLKVVDLFKNIIDKCIYYLREEILLIKTNLHMRCFSGHTYMYSIKRIVENVWEEIEKKEPNQAKIFHINSYEFTPKIEKGAKFTILEYLCRKFNELMNNFVVNHNTYCDNYNYITHHDFVKIICENLKKNIDKEINYNFILDLFDSPHKYDIDKSCKKIELENAKFSDKTKDIIQRERMEKFSSQSILENVHFKEVSDFFVLSHKRKEKSDCKKMNICLKTNEGEIQKYHSVGIFHNNSRKEQIDVISNFFTFIQDDSNFFDEKLKYIFFIDEEENGLKNFKERCFMFKDDNLKKLIKKIKKEKKMVMMNQKNEVYVFHNHAHKCYINNEEIFFKIYFKYLNYTVITTKKSKMKFQLIPEKNETNNTFLKKIKKCIQKKGERIDSNNMKSCLKILKILPEIKWKIFLIPGKMFVSKSEKINKNEFEDYNQNVFRVKRNEENDITQLKYNECNFSLKDRDFIKGVEILIFSVDHKNFYEENDENEPKNELGIKNEKISKYDFLNKYIKDNIKNDKKNTFFIFNDETVEKLIKEKGNTDLKNLFYQFNYELKPKKMLIIGKERKALKSNNGPSFFYTNNKNKVYLNGHLIDYNNPIVNGKTTVYYLNCFKKIHFDIWGVKQKIIIGISKNENLIWYLDRESQMERFDKFERLNFNPVDNELKIIF